MNRNEDRTHKTLVYAKFQFISFFAYFLLIISVLIISLSDIYSYFAFGEKINNGSLFSLSASRILTFQVNTPLGVISSLLVYFSMITIPGSWLFGLQISKDKHRTLIDSLFLIFLIVPLVSNLFALLGQVAKNEYFVENEKLNYRELLVKTVDEVKREREEELDKLKNELMELTQEHNIAINKLVDIPEEKSNIIKKLTKKKHQTDSDDIK